MIGADNRRQAENKVISSRIVQLLIVGMPRSGTSWLGKIFDRHPRILYRFEPDTVDRTGAPPYVCSDVEIPQHLAAARAYLERLAQIRTTKSVGSLPYFKKSYRSLPLDNVRLALILGLRSLERLNLWPRLWRRVVIPDLIGRDRPEALVVKSIEAVGHVNLYRKAWPDARVIVIIRHPCGQIASTLEGIRRHKFASGVAVYDDEGLLELLAATEQAKNRGLTKDRLLAMKPIERLAWMWAIPNEKAMEDAAKDPNVRVLSYEDLCEAPMNVAQDLFRFAGIAWDEAVESFIRASTDPGHAKSDSYYSVFRDPELAIDRWRSVLSADEIAMVRNAIGETLPGRLFGSW